MPTKKTKAPRLNAKLLRSSFSAVKPRGEQIARTFYKILFDRYPSVRSLFADTDLPSQHRDLIQSLAIVVASLEKPKALSTAAEQFAAFQVAGPEHAEAVSECLV